MKIFQQNCFFVLSLFLVVQCFSQKIKIKKEPFKIYQNQNVSTAPKVTDSSGKRIDNDIVIAYLKEGTHTLKLWDNANVAKGYYLHELTIDEKINFAANIDKLPKPRPSNSFEDGEKYIFIKTKDINGNKINTKKLLGKILVINYWFTNCAPCRDEIPKLNGLVKKYEGDSSVVFIAIALDDAYKIKLFLEENPFNYAIIDNGKYLADKDRVQNYPTNVVVDQEGKIHFHTSGLAPNTVHWIEKSISELKEKNIPK